MQLLLRDWALTLLRLKEKVTRPDLFRTTPSFVEPCLAQKTKYLLLSVSGISKKRLVKSRIKIYRPFPGQRGHIVSRMQSSNIPQPQLSVKRKCLHLLSGLGPVSRESPDNFSGPKSCFMFAVFAFKIKVSIILKTIQWNYQLANKIDQFVSLELC